MKNRRSQNKYLYLYDIILLILTIKSILDSDVTVFYILYLFWWRELIYTFLCFIFGKSQLLFKSDKIALSKDKSDTYLTGGIGVMLVSLFPMAIYFIFIFVLFGWVDSADNPDKVIINLNIFLFKNIYFNLSLLIFIVEFLIFSFKNYFTFDYSSEVVPFNLRHITLHISIIFGSFIKFLFVDGSEGFFSNSNSYGTLIIIMPFLLIKFFLRKSYYPMQKGNSAAKNNSL